MKSIRTLQKEFKCNIEYWTDIEKETAQFWYDEAKSLLAATQQSLHIIQQKANTLIAYSGVAISSIIAVGTYLFTNLEQAKLESINFLIIPAAIAITLYVISTVFSVLALKQDYIALIGASPEHMMKMEMVNGDNKDHQLLAILLDAAEHAQAGISHNYRIIEKVSHYSRTAYELFVAAPLLSVVFAFISFIAS